MEKITDESNINVKKNVSDGSIVMIEDKEGVHIYHVFTNDNKDFKQNYVVQKIGIKGMVKVSALLAAIVISCGLFRVFVVPKIKEYKNAKLAKELEEENIKNSLSYNIDNADITIVKMFLDEALFDLSEADENNLEASSTYNAMYNELVLAETTNDYAIHIKEGSKRASTANIYFGIGKYKKYLNAKKYNGEVYFPFDDALPTYSLEDIAGDIVITYLPDDKTPYVSSTELKEFKKSKEIERYMNTL